MRHELIDAIYLVAGQTEGALDADRDLYLTAIQSLGYFASANPHGGRRQRIGRDISGHETHWTRVLDLIVRLWPEFRRVGFQEIYRAEINRILAVHGIAWDLGADGRLHRVLPAAAEAQVEGAIQELSEPDYAPALALFNAARDAYDDWPRRDRDACSNIFDALESVAKIKYNRPNDTFGQVKNHIQQNNLLRQEVIDIFTVMNQLRNGHFGHGMAVHFALSPAEVDFVYLTCIGAILLLCRTP
ncbi:MAG: hypothetical protein L0Z53_18670 [Acidobacteriales bacterium]|nr:hypothetical protein [Terriglobales bacterium]